MLTGIKQEGVNKECRDKKKIEKKPNNKQQIKNASNSLLSPVSGRMWTKYCENQT